MLPARKITDNEALALRHFLISSILTSKKVVNDPSIGKSVIDMSLNPWVRKSSTVSFSVFVAFISASISTPVDFANVISVPLRTTCHPSNAKYWLNSPINLSKASNLSMKLTGANRSLIHFSKLGEPFITFNFISVYSHLEGNPPRP